MIRQLTELDYNFNIFREHIVVPSYPSQYLLVVIKVLQVNLLEV